MAGEDHDFIGEAFPADGHHASASCRRSRGSIPTKTVLGNVEEGVAEIRALLTRYDEINAKFGEELSPEEMDKVLEEQGKVQDAIEAANGWDLDSRLELAMDALRLPPPDADVTTLSGGERRRVALCRLLLQSPDLLLLDEPTNHLDAESVAWLERFLKDYPGTVVAVTHDRYFLDNVAGWILELDRGSGIPVGRQLLVLARAEAEAPRAARRKQETQAPADARSASSSGSACRRARGRPRARRASTPTKTCSRKRPRRRSSRSRSTFRPGPRLGDIVVEARGLRKGYGDLLLMDDMNFTLPRGGIVGVIGPNGAGKTTLFRMITGQEKPDAGTLRLGETVQGRLRRPVARRARRRTRRVWEEITGGDDEVELGKRAVASRAYVSWFNFKGRDQQRKVGALSGGERNRVHLAKLLKGGANLLLLDEPTNDLDVDTLRALEEALLVVRRLRRRHQPRPLVPRPHRDAHPGVRGRQQGGVVRGQLPGLRGRSQAPARRRGRPAAPDQVPEADAIEVGGSRGIEPASRHELERRGSMRSRSCASASSARAVRRRRPWLVLSARFAAAVRRGAARPRGSSRSRPAAPAASTTRTAAASRRS